MRTMVRLCLVSALVAAVGVVAVPTAQGQTGALGTAAITKFEKKQNKKIRKAKRKAKRAHARIENLKSWNFDLDAHNRRQDESFAGLEGTVNAIVAGVPDIIGGLTALEEGLLALQAALEDDVAPALEAIDAALNDETTGLVGLNLARPQFGVYAVDGSHLGSTGASGGLGPDDDDATQGMDLTGGGGPDLDGLYVVDFDNDVSERMYSVNVLPYVPITAGGDGETPTGSAINCAASVDIDALCDAVLPASGGDPQNVLVQIGDGSSGGATNGFSVTAISG